MGLTLSSRQSCVLDFTSSLRVARMATFDELSRFIDFSAKRDTVETVFTLQNGAR